MMTTLLFLALASQPAPTSCKPQFAPLQTATTSGSERNIWRKEEAGSWGGSGWLGWRDEGDMLQPVRFVVRDRPKDKDYPEQEEEVTVESFPEITFAVRCIPGLRAGQIRNAGVLNHDLQYNGPLDLSLGRLRYELRVEAKDPSLADATVILAHAGRTQVLYSADGFADEPHFEVIWAGDLDRDGKLDLVVNLHRKYSWHPYRLLLSTKALGKDFVGEAAVFETGD